MLTKINGHSIHCVQEGPKTANPVVFIHGFPFSMEMWKPQVRVLKNTHQVTTYDLRGHGKSAPNEGPYTIEEHVDDLFALCAHLNIEKPVVVGFSMGGYIALRAVERNETFFSGLVLCDTKSEADTNEGKVKRFQSIQDVRTKGVAAFAEGFMKNVLRPQSFKSNPELVDHVRTMITSTSPQSIMGHLLALAARTDTTESLSKFKLPAAILVGEEDGITTPANAQSMHQKISGSTLHMIPAASHLSNLENPNAFNQHIVDFLQRI